MPDEKPRLPSNLRPVAEQAALEHRERHIPPRALVVGSIHDFQIECPYSDLDRDEWLALLFEAFGTRSGSVVTAFLGNIVRLCCQSWDDDLNEWRPTQCEFDLALAIISSLEPENEAQAAYAAALFSVHRASMKLGEHIAQHSADPRTVRLLTRTVRAYGDGLLQLARLQGKLKTRTVNQTIKVFHYDNRDQRSVIFAGGVPENRGQPHGTTGETAAGFAALPGPCEDHGATVPLAGREGQAGLSNAWWARLWRSAWGR